METGSDNILSKLGKSNVVVLFKKLGCGFGYFVVWEYQTDEENRWLFLVFSEEIDNGHISGIDYN